MMNSLLLLLITVHSWGTAHYGVGVMERVSRNRGMPIVEHMCSSPFYGEAYLGEWIRVESLLTGEIIDCRITDVSQDEHRQAQIEGGRWLEVGWPTAQQICLNKTVGDKHPNECPTRFWLKSEEDALRASAERVGRSVVTFSCTEEVPFFVRRTYVRHNLVVC